MKEKVTVKFLCDSRQKWQKEKAKQMIQTFISYDEIKKYQETKEWIRIETNTHLIEIINLTQSPRGYRAHFMFDLTGFEINQETAMMKSTYWWSLTKDTVDKTIKSNGWSE